MSTRTPLSACPVPLSGADGQRHPTVVRSPRFLTGDGRTVGQWLVRLGKNNKSGQRLKRRYALTLESYEANASVIGLRKVLKGLLELMDSAASRPAKSFNSAQPYDPSDDPREFQIRYSNAQRKAQNYLQ